MKDIHDAAKKVHQRELADPEMEILKEDMFENEMNQELPSNALAVDDF